MKKNFVKKLALALAFVVVATSVNIPAANAAAAPTFKSTKATVKVGQTKKYNTTNASKYSAKFKIGNKSVATINYSKGSKAVKVTGVAEGKTTLRADFTSYKTKKVTTVKIPVTVKPGTPVVTTAELSSVKQTAANAFEATFTADASQTITADSFTSIESADGIYSAYVKSVEFSTDGKTAKVTTLNNFVDKTVYNVVCAEKTASFTASVGEVKTAVINTVQAQANVATDIVFTLYDANGIDVTSAIAIDTYVTLSVDGNYSDVDTATASKAKITLDTIGNTATVTLTYDPLTTEDKIVTVTGTITCVATQATVGKTTYFTLSDGTPKIYLNSFSADATLYDEGADEDFYFAALDKNGDAIAYDSYEVESANENVITIGSVDENGKFVKFGVTPVKAGTAKVVVRATKNEVETVYSGTVTVKAAKRLTSIALDKASLSVGNNENSVVNDKVKVTLKDQYGNTINSDTTVNASWDVSVYNNKDENNFKVEKDGRYVKVASTGADTGSYVVEIEASAGDKTLKKRFNVSVRDASKGTKSYKVELSRNSVDLNPEELQWGDGKVTARLAQYNGTVFNSYVEENVTAQIAKGSKYATSGDLTTLTGDKNTAVALSGSSIVMDTVAASGEAIKLVAGHGINGVAEIGTYTVTLKTTVDGKDVSKKATFSVKNTMEMPTVTVLTTTGEGSGVDLVKDCIKVDIDVLSENAADSVVNVLDKNYATAVEGTDGRLSIKYIEVKDTFEGDEYHYYVPVSKTFKQK